MKHFFLLLLFVFLFADGSGLMAQAFQGFEGRNTDSDCTATPCKYIDQGGATTIHELMDYTSIGGVFIPVNDASVTNVGGTDVLGFKSFFRPTRTGGVGLTESTGNLFGFVKDVAITGTFDGVGAFENSQIFMAEDTDGEVSLEFTPVRLEPGATGMFSMRYIYDGSFETGTVNDRLYVALEVTGCGVAGTIPLLDTDGGGSGGGGAGGPPPGAPNTWTALTSDLAPLAGCDVQLVIEIDTDAATEEVGFDAIDFQVGTALPVDFMSITVNQRKESVLLDWSTATETDNRGFSVERSIDGRSFAPIGWVEGSGETQAQVNYEFEDKNTRVGQQYYYRLRQEDFDGAFAYSSIVDITLVGEASEEIAGQFFPNPAVSGQSTIELYPTEAGDWSLSVIDANGRVLTETKHTLAAGYNLVPINLVKHPTGAYLVRIASKEQTVYRRVIR